MNFTDWLQQRMEVYDKDPKDLLWVGTADGEFICTWEELQRQYVPGVSQVTKQLGLAWRVTGPGGLAALVLVGDGWWFELRPLEYGEGLVVVLTYVEPPTWSPEHKMLQVFTPLEMPSRHIDRQHYSIWSGAGWLDTHLQAAVALDRIERLTGEDDPSEETIAGIVESMIAEMNPVDAEALLRSDIDDYED